MERNSFNKTLQKTVSVGILLFMMVFVFSSCDMLQDSNTLEEKNVSGENSSPHDFPFTDYTSDSIPVATPLQDIILEEIPYSVRPFGIETDIDLVVTLPFEENFSIKPKDDEAELLDIKIANDSEGIVRVDGTTVYPIEAGIATLTVQTSDETHAPMSIQVVVPPKLELYTKLGDGWWYKKIQEDTTLTQEKKDIMLKLYKMILQKPGTAFADGMANVIPIPKGKLNFDEIITVYLAVKFDYPELFWLKSTVNPYWEGINDYHAVGVHRIFSSLEDFNNKSEELETALNKFIAEIDSSLHLNSKKLLEVIFRKLVNIPYERNAITDTRGVGSQWEIHSPYGALVQNLSVCDGYSSSFALIVKKLQKEKSILKDVYMSMIVGKLSGSTYHAWNMVKYNEEWKEIDVTFAQTLRPEDNFMVSNENRSFILSGHQLNMYPFFIEKYVPFAKERNRLHKEYTKK